MFFYFSIFSGQAKTYVCDSAILYIWVACLESRLFLNLFMVWTLKRQSVNLGLNSDEFCVEGF